MKSWETLSSDVVHTNPWTKYCHDVFRLPSKKEGNYYYLQSPGAVSIVPVNSDGTISLVHQYRYLFERSSLELPGGGIKADQSPDQALVDELAEELGMSADQTKFVGKIAPLNGLVKEYQYVYVVADLKAVEHDAQPDETEEFQQVELTPDQIDAAIVAGEIWDGFCISTWALAKPHVLEILKQQKRK